MNRCLSRPGLEFATLSRAANRPVTSAVKAPPSPSRVTWCFFALRRLSAALLPSLAAVAVPLRVHVDRVLLPLALALGSALALLLGPEHHVGERHEHLARNRTEPSDVAGNTSELRLED